MAGVNTEFIRESVGPTDRWTAENYQDSFEKDVKDEFAQAYLISSMIIRIHDGWLYASTIRMR